MQCSKYICVLLLLFTSTTISTETAFNCYQCNSAVNPECANLHDHPPHNVSVFYKPCEIDYKEDDATDEDFEPLCRLIKYKFKFLKSADPQANRVIRSCGYRKSPKECYVADNDHHLETVCQCFTDGCNTAASLSIFSGISTIAMGFLLYLFA